MTVEITDEDRDEMRSLAHEVLSRLTCVTRYGEGHEIALAGEFTRVRAAAYAAGREEAADDAHAAGYAEGVAAGRGAMLDELTITLGTARHAVEELEGDLHLARFVVEQLEAAGVTNP